MSQLPCFCRDRLAQIEENRVAGGQGASFFTAANPEVGAPVTYYLGETLRTREEERQRAERHVAKEGGDKPYPTWEELEAVDREEGPVVFLTVRDADGNVVRHVNGATRRGVHRATWNLRFPGTSPWTSTTMATASGRSPSPAATA